jgi:hypothetical protein
MRCKLSRPLVMPVTPLVDGGCQTARRAEALLASSEPFAFVDWGVESVGGRTGAGAAQ